MHCTGQQPRGQLPRRTGDSQGPLKLVQLLVGNSGALASCNRAGRCHGNQVLMSTYTC